MGNFIPILSENLEALLTTFTKINSIFIILHKNHYIFTNIISFGIMYVKNMTLAMRSKEVFFNFLRGGFF